MVRMPVVCHELITFGVSVVTDWCGTGVSPVGPQAGRLCHTIVPAPQRYRGTDYAIEPDASNASYFLGSGSLLWVTWQLATLAGILAGQIIPASWQLEFVVPLCFLAVLVPLLRDRIAILVFTVATVAVIALDAMPLRLSMVCSGLLGIAAGVLGDKMAARRG